MASTDANFVLLRERLRSWVGTGMLILALSAPTGFAFHAGPAASAPAVSPTIEHTPPVPHVPPKPIPIPPKPKVPTGPQTSYAVPLLVTIVVIGLLTIIVWQFVRRRATLPQAAAARSLSSAEARAQPQRAPAVSFARSSTRDVQDPRGVGWSPVDSAESKGGLQTEGSTGGHSSRTATDQPRRELYAGSATQSETSIAGMIRGEVREFQSRTETGYDWFDKSGQPIIGTETVWTFQVDRYGNAGDALQPVAVEMRGRTFAGSIRNGDQIVVQASNWQEGQLLRPKAIRNLTRGESVHSYGRPFKDPFRAKIFQLLGASLAIIVVGVPLSALWTSASKATGADVYLPVLTYGGVLVVIWVASIPFFVRRIRSRSRKSGAAKPILIRGEARRFQARSEPITRDVTLVVWNFDLEHYDHSGNKRCSVPIEMRARSFSGRVADGDEIEIVLNHFQEGKTMYPTRVHNFTFGADVVPRS